MTFTQDTQKSVLDPDADTSTIYTAMTPPSTIIDSDNHDDDDKNLNDNKDDDNDKNNDKTSHASSSIPWPGSTFLIRASSSGKLLTLDTGNVILARPGTNGPSIHWKCTEVKGWLHFQNAASGCYLGHAFWGGIICAATNPDGWERFTARLRPEGGFYLMMTHWERLWKVGIKEGNLAKIWEGEWGDYHNTGEGEGQVILWEFIKV